MFQNLTFQSLESSRVLDVHGGFYKMSATDTNKLRTRVAILDKLLDDFDGQLDDLLAKSLPETLLGLDTLQQAKLQVTVPYLVYDLVISEFSISNSAIRRE